MTVRDEPGCEFPYSRSARSAGSEAADGHALVERLRPYTLTGKGEPHSWRWVVRRRHARRWIAQLREQAK